MNNPQYTLIGSPASRSFRVVWALEEMGLSYELKPAKPHNEEIKSINPSGKIPAMIDHDSGGQVIIDSVAIVQYLADKHQQLTHKAGTVERAQQDSFTQFACDEMDGTIWIVAKHSFVMPEELRSKEAVKKAADWDFARAMQALGERLGDNRYVTGDKFTVPDLILTHCSGWATRAGFAIPPGIVADYFSRISERDAFKRAMELRENA